MTRLLLVRHGRAAAGWDADADPGLDAVGVAQAEAMAEAVASLGPLPIVVSPLRRTRETAAVLEQRWSTVARVEPGVGEIPTPQALDVATRGPWLRGVLSSRWSDLDAELQAWRTSAINTLVALGATDVASAVVVTHFVLINVAVGAATGDDRVVCFSPDNCSRTVLDVDAVTGTLRVVELGASASTHVG